MMDEAKPDAVDVTKALQLNEGTFSSEIIDGELILLNRYEGIYYSAGGSIAEIWPILVSGASLASILEEARRMFADQPDLAARETLRFVEALVAEGIIFQTPPAGPMRSTGRNQAGPFASFNFEKYADLQDILTLDPLHDVDVLSGWPAPRR